METPWSSLRRSLSLWEMGSPQSFTVVESTHILLVNFLVAEANYPIPNWLISQFTFVLFTFSLWWSSTVFPPCVLTFYFSSVSVQPTLLPVKVSTRNDEQVNSCKNGPNLKEDWQSEQKMGHNNVDDDDDDNGNEDDDDDQGTVEGGSRLSVDKRERTPSLLHLVGFFYLFTLIWF